jgi:hypothetical protein
MKKGKSSRTPILQYSEQSIYSCPQSRTIYNVQEESIVIRSWKDLAIVVAARAAAFVHDESIGVELF